MLAADELDAMRATIAASMPDTALIVTPTSGDDVGGGFVDAAPYSVRASEVPCRFSAGSGDEQASAYGGGIVTRSQHRLTLPFGTPVEARDVVIVGERVFDVLDVASPKSYDVAVRVSVVERGDGAAPEVEEPTP